MAFKQGPNPVYWKQNVASWWRWGWSQNLPFRFQEDQSWCPHSTIWLLKKPSTKIKGVSHRSPQQQTSALGLIRKGFGVVTVFKISDLQRDFKEPTKFLRELHEDKCNWLEVNESDRDSMKWRGIGHPSPSLPAESWLRKLLRCKDVLQFWKKEDDFEDGFKSHKEFFPKPWDLIKELSIVLPTTF